MLGTFRVPSAPVRHSEPSRQDALAFSVDVGLPAFTLDLSRPAERSGAVTASESAATVISSAPPPASSGSIRDYGRAG